MATVEGSYEGGGIGGKFRRRPFRKSSAATPYDRPPAADRALRNRIIQGERNGWLSKLVDPASRMIASGASRFFASVFRKRLGPPPAATAMATGETVENVQSTNEGSREHVLDVTSVNPLSQAVYEGARDVESAKDKSDVSTISEFEQLLKQKTFTRVEFERLTDLLRSRTIDLSAESEGKIPEPGLSQPMFQTGKQERSALPTSNGIGCSMLLGGISRPDATVNVPEEEIASPTELAKAYMGSRPSKVASPTSSLRHPVRRDIATLPSTGQSVSEFSNGLVAPRSVVHFSGLGESGYRTPRPQGRSAIYKMSQSPYFKAQLMVSHQGAGSSMERNGWNASSQTAPSPTFISGGKQALKRRSSFIDNDPGSFGPIRRIRQKSNMVSPVKSNLSSAGTSISTPAANSTSVSRPLLPTGLNHTSTLEGGNYGINNGSANSVSVPQQSSLMARKILQQLEHLVPSPKEKSSVPKAISANEAPSKLTIDMLNEQALKSVKEVDVSDKFNVENGSHKTSFGIPTSQIQDRVENSGPMKPISRVKILSEVDDLETVPSAVTDIKPGTAAVSSLIPSSATPFPKKPSFQMQAPESSWEMDTENGGGNAPEISSFEKEKLKVCIAEASIVIDKADSSKKPFASSYENRLDLTSTPSRKAENGGLGSSALFGNDNGFKFASAASDIVFSCPLPTPSLPSLPAKQSVPAPLKEQPFTLSAPQLEQAAPQKKEASVLSAPMKEQSFTPVFDFGSKGAPTVTFSSASSTLSDSTGLKFGASTSTATMTTNLTETPGSNKFKEADVVGEPSEHLRSSVPSGSFMSAVPGPFAFGAPATSAPITAFGASSNILAGSTTSNISTPQVSEAASLLNFPLVPSFQDGSETKAVSINSVLSTVTKSVTEDLEPEASKESPFGITSFSAPVASPTVSTSGSSLFGFSFSTPSSASSTSGQLLGTQASQSGSGTSIFTQSLTSQLPSSSSSTIGLGVSSSFSSSNSAFGSSISGAKPFAFVSSSGSGQSSSISFSASAPSNTSSSSTFASSMTASSFFSSTQPASSSIFGSGFASGSSTSTGFSFGLSSASAANVPLSFGSASGPTFSFTSTGNLATVAPQSLSGFGMAAPVSFGSILSRNDQMNVEDSMTDDIVQTAMPTAPVFRQITTPPAQSISFGSSAPQQGGTLGFQFGGPPGPAFPQGQSPFQTSGNLEFAAGGSFSLGSGGGDKSSRRIVKVKRDKHRKK